MGWHETAPVGTNTVKANESTLNDNTVYTETEMNKDHFWNIGGDEDGHHKFAQMPKYTDGAIATPTSPTLVGSADLAYFARLKTAAEAPGGADVQPYIRNASATMQLLGIRAMGVFTVAGGLIVMQYSHNLDAANPVTFQGGATGKFIAKFATALPTNNYAVLGGGVFSGGTEDFMHLNVQGSDSGPLTNSKKVDLVNFRTYVLTAGDQQNVNPLQCWFICFGG